MTMSRLKGCAVLPLLGCVVGVAPLTMGAQEKGMAGPPPVLVIQREFTKPGKGGALHEKTESAYIAAAKAAKAPFRYLAVTSMSGESRALFLSGYPTLAAWEAENKAVDKIAGLDAALDHANVVDGDLLASTSASVWTYREELSLNPAGVMPGDRFMEIEQIGVKPGHQADFEELGKMFVEGYKKIPGAHWAIYQQIYGTNANGFIVVTALKGLGEADAEWGASTKAFEAAMGPAGMKKLGELMAACVETDQTNLFGFSPKMSYPPDAWVTGEPEYWKPKAAAAPVKKATP